MSPQKSIFLCTFIARYCAIYRSSVIFLSGGTWIDDRAAFCSHEDFLPAAVLVLSNLTVVFDHVAEKFVLRQHFLVVVPALHSFANAKDWSELERYTPRLGFSRWLLLQESPLNDQKNRNYLPSGSPEGFLCFAIIVSNVTANVPADFNECSARKTVEGADLIRELVNLPKDQFTIVCNQEHCSPDRMQDDVFIDAMRIQLNVSYIKTMRIDTNQTKNAIVENALLLLGTRRADYYSRPLVLSYERATRAVFTYPTLFYNHKILSWKQPEHTIGSDGLMKMFNRCVWLGFGIYLGLQIALVSLTFTREVSVGALFVFSTFLGVPNETRRHLAWKLNSSFLYFCAFIFGSVFRNKLTSCLNRTVLLSVDSADELRAAIDSGFISSICTKRLDYFYNRMSLDTDDPTLQILLGLRERNGIYGAKDDRACIEFLRESRSHAAVIPIPVSRPSVHFCNTFERANIYLGRDTLYSIIVGFAYAPGLPLEAKLRRLERSLFEAEAYRNFEETWRGKITVTAGVRTVGRALNQNDLSLPLFLIMFGSVLSSSVMFLSNILKVCEKRMNGSKRISDRSYRSKRTC